MSKIMSNQVLRWAERDKVHRSQRALIENLKDNRDFDMVKGKYKEKLRNDRIKMKKSAMVPREHMEKYRYCGATHQPGWWPAYGKICSGCGKVNHFRSMCRSPDNKTSFGQGNKQT